ncbi:MAG: tetratricopeptide repeat protein [Candidatus Hydrogenedentota bacterium]
MMIRYFLYSIILVVFIFNVVLLGEESASYWNEKGVQATQKGDWNEAVKCFEKAYRLKPDEEIIKENLFKSYLSLASYLIEKKKFNDALKWAKRARKLKNNKEVSKTLAILYGNYAVYIASKGKLNDAISYAYKAIEYDPSNKTLKDNYVNLTLNYAFSVDGDLRKNALLNVLKYKPDSVTALSGLGNIYYDEDDLENAIKYYGETLKYDPDNDMIRYKYEKAKKEYSQEKNYKKTKRVRFTVKYEGIERSDLAWQVLNILDEAYYLLRNKIGFWSAKKLTVIIYTGEKYKTVSGVPDWSGGLYDGKIRVKEGDISGNQKQLKDILYHEYVHALIHERVGNEITVWMNEGLAQYFEPSRTWSDEYRKELALTIDTPDWLPLKTLNTTFVKFEDAKKAAQAYKESYSVAYYLSKTYGEYSFIRLLDTIHQGDTFGEAFKKIYFIDLDTFETNWKFFLKTG